MADSKQYDVYRVEDSGERGARAGRVGLDAGNKLELVAAEGDAEADLRDAIEEINGSDTLFHKHPSDRTGEDGRTIVAKDEVGRGDPDFLAALQDNLRRWHALELDLPEES